jgi:hypothetical protein
LAALRQASTAAVGGPYGRRAEPRLSTTETVFLRWPSRLMLKAVVHCVCRVTLVRFTVLPLSPNAQIRLLNRRGALRGWFKRDRVLPKANLAPIPAAERPHRLSVHAPAP